MKYDKFFELAKNAGVEESELYIYEKTSLSMSLFHGELDNFEVSKGGNVLARGLLNGKFGAVVADSYSNQKAQFFIEQIVQNAKIIEKDEPNFIFKGSPKYKKINTFNKVLPTIDIEEKKKLLFELEKKILAADPRISEVASVGYEENSSISSIINSHGLKLSTKGNIFYYYGEAVAKDKEQVKTGFYFFINNDISTFNVDELAKKIAETALEQLNGEACATGKYKAVLDRSVVASLVDVLVSYASAESVQKKTSLFIGKLNQKVASKKITISDKPLAKSLFARGFDDEGVATYNKDIIKNGVLKTYLYNLTTASKDGVTTTGNAVGGTKKSVGAFYTYMKPGKKELEQLFEEVKDGVYITGVQGLHAGLNAQSGNFSLQAEGFMIENGKKTHPLDIITISGNILEVFSNVLEVGADSREFISGTNCPSLLIKSINVSGK